MKPQDPIVHIDHGVGRYEGLKSLSIDGKSDEFIVVSYKGGGKLYIPVFNIGVLSRHSPNTSLFADQLDINNGYLIPISHDHLFGRLSVGPE